MLTQQAAQVKKLVKADGVLQLEPGDLQTLIQMNADLFQEEVTVAHPLTGEITTEMRIPWKKLSGKYVHSVLKKNHRL